MPRTSNIYARVEPEIKEQAEHILEQLGVPMSNAISIFLRQVIMQRGLPFDMKLPNNDVLSYAELSEDAFNAEMEKGYADMTAGNVISAKTVEANMNERYGI